jgi:hypothetical protein
MRKTDFEKLGVRITLYWAADMVAQNEEGCT